MVTSYLKVTTCAVVIVFLSASASLGQVPQISNGTLNAIMMCGPLDTKSTDLKNCKMALSILKKNSEHGDPYADFYISIAYSNGIAVNKNSKISFSYMLSSAKGGDKAALYYVGASYLFGAGTSIDIKSALIWLGKSAYAGDADAQYLLGQIYSEQKYGHQNLKLSYLWYDIAYIGGMSSAKPMRDTIGALLPANDQKATHKIAKKLAMELDSRVLPPGN